MLCVQRFGCFFWVKGINLKANSETPKHLAQAIIDVRKDRMPFLTSPMACVGPRTQDDVGLSRVHYR